MFITLPKKHALSVVSLIILLINNVTVKSQSKSNYIISNLFLAFYFRKLI